MINNLMTFVYICRYRPFPFRVRHMVGEGVGEWGEGIVFYKHIF